LIGYLRDEMVFVRVVMWLGLVMSKVGYKKGRGDPKG